MRLRPPVRDIELEIDPNNGMKKYIATEGEGFETSTSCIRMHLRRCIELGRSEYINFRLRHAFLTCGYSELQRADWNPVVMQMEAKKSASRLTESWVPHFIPWKITSHTVSGFCCVGRFSHADTF